MTEQQLEKKLKGVPPELGLRAMVAWLGQYKLLKVEDVAKSLVKAGQVRYTLIIETPSGGPRQYSRWVVVGNSYQVKPYFGLEDEQPIGVSELLALLGRSNPSRPRSGVTQGAAEAELYRLGYTDLKYLGPSPDQSKLLFRVTELNRMTGLLGRYTVGVRREPGTDQPKVTPTRKLSGFPTAIAAWVEPRLDQVLLLVERMARRKVLFPFPIRPMTPEEIAEGRRITGPGHEGGAGHGLWDPVHREVRVNASMAPFDVLANIVHEFLHMVFPSADEVTVDRWTDEVLVAAGLLVNGRPVSNGRRS